MITEVLSARLPSSLETAIALLLAGEVIALPTDTVYGVASDGLNPEAIEKLYSVKERPRDKAIPLLLADPSDLDLVASEVSDEARLLANRFWPGPLTLVIGAKPNVPAILRADGNTVAVRIPDHPIPRNLARALGRPLAATSANISGGLNPSTVDEALFQLQGRIPLIIDGGPVGMGVPSTVVDASASPPRVLRVGALAVREIEAALQEQR